MFDSQEQEKHGNPNKQGQIKQSETTKKGKIVMMLLRH